MKTEIKIFFTALMFYTRIPCPKWVAYSPELLNKSTRYFPIIGWIVGTLSFLVYCISHLVFSVEIAVLMSIAAGVLLTGSFHEDGLADGFDGFGGGWTKSSILDIMKDSRLGTYGAVALIFLFGFKFFALRDLLIELQGKGLLFLLLLFINYHTLARFTAINITFISSYSRDDESSKSKPIVKAYSAKEIIGVYVFGLLPLLILLTYNGVFLFLLFPLAGLFFFSQRYFKKWIDGYTGDCLGAVEQLAEVIILLTYLIVWKFM
ncbi:adenosylcobinamide-GDP ribazoletransferase [Flavobacterium sp. NKUCC04_CG]|uniref:adenosylcobinamide-GDP ribazoletransferase n=1 Tax=Flavobacterium sp. NKUCC04_CG TaxID=2842121 RepID=UPI001C5B755D|nr:adenosylcobinamide-GDP ribazoletransferase [Flavobacterium sp. NKUCC04_CG]MBW3519935.1 adenosylcobinamide-GDP ribazoletransferase [Flavobacterium sp. NKUCC04_CG]